MPTDATLGGCVAAVLRLLRRLLRMLLRRQRMSLPAQSMQSAQLRRHLPVMPSIVAASLSHLPLATAALQDIASGLSAMRLSNYTTPPLHQANARHSRAITGRPAVLALASQLEGVILRAIHHIVHPGCRNPLGTYETVLE